MNIVLNGIKINYNCYGADEKPPLIFIHGFPLTSDMWKPQVDEFKKDFFVITYDVRGHGKSEIGNGQYFLEYFVDDLLALLDHLKIKTCTAVSLSMGGYIILRAMERYPERFRALVLCDTKSEADNNDGKIKRAIQANSIMKEGIEPFVEPFINIILSEKTIQAKPEVVNNVRTMIRSSSPKGVVGTLLALAARTDTTSSLYNIKIPTLILVGQHDKLTPPSASHAMGQKLSNAKVRIISKAGHLSNLENPEEFNKHLATFLKSLKK